MHLQALALAALALEGALASPSHLHMNRRHLHELLHRRYDPCDIENYKTQSWYAQKKAEGTPLMGCSGSSSQGSSGAAAAVKPASQAPSSQPSSSSSTSGSQQKSTVNGQCSNLQDAFSNPDTTGGAGPTAADSTCLQHRKRATDAQVNAGGNTGGSCYGSNITPAKNCQPSGQYALTIVNRLGSTQKFWVWNKAGPSGQGTAGMMNHAFYQFSLDNGEHAVFDIASGTMMGFSTACGRATGHGGVPNCDIGEANFGCTVDKCTGGSYYDVSTVINNEAAAEHPQMIPISIKADDPYSASTNTQCNFYRSDQDHPDDLSCHLGPDTNDGKPFHPVATFG